MSAIRVAIVWDTRTQWLGGWNYFLNMVRTANVFAPDLRFLLLSTPGLAAGQQRAAEEAGAEVYQALPPFARFSHQRVLLGGGHPAVRAGLRAASADLVFELTNYLGETGVPALAWIPDAQHRALPRMFSLRQRLQRDLEFRRRLTVRRHLMLSSEAARQDILDFMPAPRARLHVVPFAVRPTLVLDEAAITAARARYALEPGFIFFPGQFWEHKNHLLALEAMRLLAARGRNVQLILSGQALDTRNAAHADLLAIALERAQATRVLGVIPYDDLLALIAGSRALFNPSLFEGWSTTVEEAKALGTAMVLSDLRVHREQADGRAIFFDPRDAQGAAAALEKALDLPVAANSAHREAAARANLTAQRLFAEKLEVACRAAISGA